MSVEQAEANVAAAEKELESAEEALDGVVIRAPMDGTILTVGGEVGDTATARASFITLGDLDEMQVNALFTESDIGRIKVGQPAVITTDSKQGEEFTGSVTHLDVIATTSDQLVRYGARISFDHQPDGLLLGQTMSVRVVTGEAEDALSIPAQAVQLGNDGIASVTVRDDGQDVRRTVRVGVRGDQYVEILDGLAEGDEVLVSDGLATNDFPNEGFPGLTATPGTSPPT
jgi:RND family efflux transporter MFP subunit